MRINTDHPPLLPNAGSPAGVSLNKSLAVWHLILTSGVVTFIAFVLLDPNPDVIFAICAAINWMVMLGSIYKLYQWELLLSPYAAVYIGPGWIIFYTWGNLGARILGDERYIANIGNLEFYSQVALLSTLGLLLYTYLVFGVFGSRMRLYKIRYQDLVWQPYQVISVLIIVILQLVYLSSRYPFENGYFRDVTSIFDQWMAFSFYAFIILGYLISVSVFLKSSRKRSRIIALMALGILIFVSVITRSRTFMFSGLIMVGTAWLTLRPDHIRYLIPAAAISVPLIYGLGTVVKAQTESESIFENAQIVISFDAESVRSNSENALLVDIGYRMAGFDLPAGILLSQSTGRSTANGMMLIGGFLQGLPSFLRPAVDLPGSERQVLELLYRGQGVPYTDATGIPLTSGIAEIGGILGFLIYVPVALFCVAAWQIAQYTPRLFLTFLIVGFGPSQGTRGLGDLVWEHLFSAVIKQGGFIFLSLVILSVLLMPRHNPVQLPD